MAKKNWKQPLSSPVALSDGTTVHTLEQARRTLQVYCKGLRMPALDYANELLEQAAASGTAEDRADATAQLCRVLKFNKLV